MGVVVCTYVVRGPANEIKCLSQIVKGRAGDRPPTLNAHQSYPDGDASVRLAGAVDRDGWMGGWVASSCVRIAAGMI